MSNQVNPISSNLPYSPPDNNNNIPTPSVGTPFGHSTTTTLQSMQSDSMSVNPSTSPDANEVIMDQILVEVVFEKCCPLFFPKMENTTLKQACQIYISHIKMYPCLASKSEKQLREEFRKLLEPSNVSPSLNLGLNDAIMISPVPSDRETYFSTLWKNNRMAIVTLDDVSASGLHHLLPLGQIHSVGDYSIQLLPPDEEESTLLKNVGIERIKFSISHRVTGESREISHYRRLAWTYDLMTMSAFAVLCQQLNDKVWVIPSNTDNGRMATLVATLVAYKSLNIECIPSLVPQILANLPQECGRIQSLYQYLTIYPALRAACAIKHCYSTIYKRKI